MSINVTAVTKTTTRRIHVGTNISPERAIHEQRERDARQARIIASFAGC
jgi:hypothetical protein